MIGITADGTSSKTAFTNAQGCLEIPKMTILPLKINGKSTTAIDGAWCKISA